MTQSEQLAQVRAAARKALDRAVGSLSLAHGGVINVAGLNVDTCEAVQRKPKATAKDNNNE